MSLIKGIKKKIELIKVSSFKLRKRDINLIQNFIHKTPNLHKLIFFISLFIPPIITGPLYLPYFLYKYITRKLKISQSNIKIKLKDIDGAYSEYTTIKELLKDKTRNEENVVNYKWDLLKESIKKYKNLQPLEVKEFNSRYRLLDGNHRHLILKDLYGEDYEVNIKIIKTDESKY